MKTKYSLQLASVITALLISTTASASIEVKAKRALTEATMQSEITKVTKACDNKALEVNFDWSAWDSYDFKQERLDEVKTTGWLGPLIDSIYDDMVKLCTTTEHAALYKQEFAKVTKLQFSGQDSIKARKSAFSLSEEGKVLIVKLNANAAYDSSTLKYIKEAWN